MFYVYNFPFTIKSIIYGLDAFQNSSKTKKTKIIENVDSTRLRAPVIFYSENLCNVPEQSRDEHPKEHRPRKNKGEGPDRGKILVETEFWALRRDGNCLIM